MIILDPWLERWGLHNTLPTGGSTSLGLYAGGKVGRTDRPKINLLMLPRAHSLLWKGTGGAPTAAAAWSSSPEHTYIL